MAMSMILSFFLYFPTHADWTQTLWYQSANQDNSVTSHWLKYLPYSIKFQNCQKWLYPTLHQVLEWYVTEVCIFSPKVGSLISLCLKEFGLLSVVCLTSSGTIISLLRPVHRKPCSFYLTLLEASCMCEQTPTPLWRSLCGEEPRTQPSATDPQAGRQHQFATLEMGPLALLNHHSWCCRSKREQCFLSPA